MPWLALPFGDERIQKLENECGVSGIPMFCVVDRQGKVLIKEARGTVTKFGSSALSELEKVVAQK